MHQARAAQRTSSQELFATAITVGDHLLGALFRIPRTGIIAALQFVNRLLQRNLPPFRGKLDSAPIDPFEMLACDDTGDVIVGTTGADLVSEAALDAGAGEMAAHLLELVVSVSSREIIDPEPDHPRQLQPVHPLTLRGAVLVCQAGEPGSQTPRNRALPAIAATFQLAPSSFIGTAEAPPVPAPPVAVVVVSSSPPQPASARAMRRAAMAGKTQVDFT